VYLYYILICICKYIYRCLWFMWCQIDGFFSRYGSFFIDTIRYTSSWNCGRRKGLCLYVLYFILCCVICIVHMYCMYIWSEHMDPFLLIQLDTPVTEVVAGEKVYKHKYLHLFILILYYINVSVGTFVWKIVFHLIFFILFDLNKPHHYHNRRRRAVTNLIKIWIKTLTAVMQRYC
jgi:hypothetical protein